MAIMQSARRHRAPSRGAFSFFLRGLRSTRAVGLPLLGPAFRENRKKNKTKQKTVSSRDTSKRVPATLAQMEDYRGLHVQRCLLCCVCVMANKCVCTLACRAVPLYSHLALR